MVSRVMIEEEFFARSSLDLSTCISLATYMKLVIGGSGYPLHSGVYFCFSCLLLLCCWISGSMIEDIEGIEPSSARGCFAGE